MGWHTSSFLDIRRPTTMAEPDAESSALWLCAAIQGARRLLSRCYSDYISIALLAIARYCGRFEPYRTAQPHAGALGVPNPAPSVL